MDVILFLIAVILFSIFYNRRESIFTLFNNSYIYTDTVNTPSETIETIARKAALKEAHIFLSPYKDIWRI